MAPSAPAVRPCGSDDGVGGLYSSTCPAGVIRPMQLAAHSVNQHPSSEGSAMIAWGRAERAGSGYSGVCPVAVIRPIRSAPIWVYHSAPSGPEVMPNGPLPAVTGNAETSPLVVMRPIASAWFRVNQSAPSGPVVIVDGRPDDGPAW